MTIKDKAKNLAKKEVEKAGLINLWGAIIIIVGLIISGYKVWTWSSTVPELEQGQTRIEKKVDDIGCYLARQTSQCEPSLGYSVMMSITDTTWQKILNKKQ